MNVILFVLVTLFCSIACAMEPERLPDWQDDLDDFVADESPHELALRGDVYALRQLAPVIDLTQPNSHGRTPLQVAAAAGRFDCVAELVQHECSEPAIEKALLLAAKNKHIPIVMGLINEGRSRAFNASKQSSDGPFKFLVTLDLGRYAETHGAFRGQHIISAAVTSGCAEIVKVLLHVKIDPNTVAESYTNAEGAVIPAEPLVVRAARMHNADIINLLVEKRASVNKTSQEGVSALMHAAGTGNIEGLRILLESDADPRLLDNSGWSATGYAHRSGFAALCALLAPIQPVLSDSAEETLLIEGTEGVQMVKRRLKKKTISDMVSSLLSLTQ